MAWGAQSIAAGVVPGTTDQAVVILPEESGYENEVDPPLLEFFRDDDEIVPDAVFIVGRSPPEPHPQGCDVDLLRYQLPSEPAEYTVVHRLRNAPPGLEVAGSPPIEMFRGEPALITLIEVRR